jgi:hypothetical protein
MILLTPDLRERLLANGRKRNLDHVPVVKFFNPLGVGTWLATELEKDGDQLFGLCSVQHKPNYVEHEVMLEQRSSPCF